MSSEIAEKIMQQLPDNCHFKSKLMQRTVDLLMNQKEIYEELEYCGSSDHSIVLKAFNTQENRIVALKIVECLKKQILDEELNEIEKNQLESFSDHLFFVKNYNQFYLTEDVKMDLPDEEEQDNDSDQSQEEDSCSQENKSQNSENEVKKEIYLDQTSLKLKVFFVVEMEYIKDQSLCYLIESQIKKKKEIDDQKKELITIQILNVLIQIHQRGQAHKNIKPSNIFVAFDDDEIPNIKLSIDEYPSIQEARNQFKVRGKKDYILTKKYLQNRNEIELDMFGLGIVLIELDNVTKFNYQKAKEKKEELLSQQGIFSKSNIKRDSLLYTIAELSLMRQKTQYKVIQELFIIVLLYSTVPREKIINSLLHDIQSVSSSIQQLNTTILQETKVSSKEKQTSMKESSKGIKKTTSKSKDEKKISNKNSKSKKNNSDSEKEEFENHSESENHTDDDQPSLKKSSDSRQSQSNISKQQSKSSSLKASSEKNQSIKTSKTKQKQETKDEDIEETPFSDNQEENDVQQKSSSKNKSKQYDSKQKISQNSKSSIKQEKIIKGEKRKQDSDNEEKISDGQSEEHNSGKKSNKDIKDTNKNMEKTKKVSTKSTEEILKDFETFQEIKKHKIAPPLTKDQFNKILGFINTLTSQYKKNEYELIDYGENSVILGVNRVNQERESVLKIQLMKNKANILKEIGMMRICQMPYIIKFYDYYFFTNKETKEEFVLYELERCSTTLENLIPTDTFQQNDELKYKIAIQMLDALNYLHANNMICSQLRLHNFLISESDNIISIKLTSFRLFQILNEQEFYDAEYQIQNQIEIDQYQKEKEDKIFNEKEEQNKIYILLQKQTDIHQLGICLILLDNYIKLKSKQLNNFEKIHNKCENRQYYLTQLNKETKTFQIIDSILSQKSNEKYKLSDILEKLGQQYYSKIYSYQDINEHCQDISILSIDEIKISVDTFNLEIIKCENLKVLNLYLSNNELTSRNFISIANSITEIQTLVSINITFNSTNLVPQTIVFIAQEIAKFEQLSSLVLNFFVFNPEYQMIQIDNKNLISVITQIAQLNELSILNLNTIPSVEPLKNDEMTNIFKQLNKLKILSVCRLNTFKNTENKVLCLQEWENIQQYQDLKINFVCKQVDFDQLKKCSNLEKLQIQLSYPGQLTGLQQLTQLKSLIISFPYQGNQQYDEILLSTSNEIQYINQLQSLVLDFSQGYLNDVNNYNCFSKALLTFTNLKYLYLNFYYYQNVGTLFNAIQNLHFLEFLTIQFEHSNISQIASSISKCSNLKYLFLEFSLINPNNGCYDNQYFDQQLLEMFKNLNNCSYLQFLNIKVEKHTFNKTQELLQVIRDMIKKQNLKVFNLADRGNLSNGPSPGFYNMLDLIKIVD